MNTSSFSSQAKKQEDQIAIRNTFLSKNEKSMTSSFHVIYRPESVKILEVLKRKPRKK